MHNILENEYINNIDLLRYFKVSCMCIYNDLIYKSK